MDRWKKGRKEGIEGRKEGRVGRNGGMDGLMNGEEEGGGRE